MKDSESSEHFADEASWGSSERYEHFARFARDFARCSVGDTGSYSSDFQQHSGRSGHFGLAGAVTGDAAAAAAVAVAAAMPCSPSPQSGQASKRTLHSGPSVLAGPAAPVGLWEQLAWVAVAHSAGKPHLLCMTAALLRVKSAG